jgi:hypothetical protein
MSAPLGDSHDFLTTPLGVRTPFHFLLLHYYSRPFTQQPE